MNSGIHDRNMTIELTECSRGHDVKRPPIEQNTKRTVQYTE